MGSCKIAAVDWTGPVLQRNIGAISPFCGCWCPGFADLRCVMHPSNLADLKMEHVTCSVFWGRTLLTQICGDRLFPQVVVRLTTFFSF